MSSKSWVGGGDPLAGGGVGDFSSVCAGVSIVWGWFGVGGSVGSDVGREEKEAKLHLLVDSDVSDLEEDLHFQYHNEVEDQ